MKTCRCLSYNDAMVLLILGLKWTNNIDWSWWWVAGIILTITVVESVSDGIRR